MLPIAIRYLLFSSALSIMLVGPARAAAVFEQSEQSTHVVAASGGTAKPIVADKVIQQPGTWRIESSEQVAKAFRRWAQMSNWQLVWEAPDLVAQTSAELTGDFEEVIGKTIDALNRSGSGLQARFYATNRVLRIVERK